jgi:hypothetical protein
VKREDLVAADRFFRESLKIDRKLHEKAPDSEQAAESPEAFHWLDAVTLH